MNLIEFFLSDDQLFQFSSLIHVENDVQNFIGC